MHPKTSWLIGLMLMALVGCTNMTPKEQGTLSGAAMGAAAGAGGVTRLPLYC